MIKNCKILKTVEIKDTGVWRLDAGCCSYGVILPLREQIFNY